MNARFARVLSRLSIVSVVAVSALGAAACSRAQTSDTRPAVAAEAQPVEGASAATPHTPGYRMFRQIDELDLRAAQRESLGELEQNLAADLQPHRETIRQVAHTLAAGIEAGQLDAEESAAQQAALKAAVIDAKASFAAALNEVHDTLDADQRAALVQKLREQHERHAADRARREREAQQHAEAPLAKIVAQVSLTDEQRQELREVFRKAVDEVFPDRKVRREVWEAKMKALADAFLTEDFDAADFDLVGGVEDSIQKVGDVAALAIDAGGRVLSDGQRKALAEMLREHAQKI